MNEMMGSKFHQWRFNVYVYIYNIVIKHKSMSMMTLQMAEKNGKDR